MKHDLSVAPPANASEEAYYVALMAETFVSPPERSAEYLQSVGVDQVRLVRVGGQPVGGLALLPKGQYFGGRRIPMVGVAAVCVDPTQRAGGAASELMRQTLSEQHAAGMPLSALYPATVKLYRRAGYECAGVEALLKVNLDGITCRDREAPMRPVRPEDEPMLHAAYQQWAARHPGNVDRTEFHWNRILDLRGSKATGYVVTNGDRIDGYVYFVTTTEPKLWNMDVRDIVALTPAAARRLLTFLADHRTIRQFASWKSSPADPLLLHLGEPCYEFTRARPWMLRIVHVANALAARGYAPVVQAELHFDVADDVLPENGGRWTLRVEAGTAQVTRGGRGSLAIDVRGLAALYSGYQSPSDLVLAGRLSAPEAELAAAAAVFGGPLPWMRDAF